MSNTIIIPERTSSRLQLLELKFSASTMTWLVNISCYIDIPSYIGNAGMQVYHKGEVKPDGSPESERAWVDCDRQDGVEHV